MVQSVPVSLADGDDCEYPAYAVAVQYAVATLRRLVRGEGLAYDVHMQGGMDKVGEEEDGGGVALLSATRLSI